MKQQKKSWVKTLLSFAEPCKGTMILSVYVLFLVSLVELFRFGQFIKFCFCLSTVLPQETIFCYGAWLE